jgi:hypothetical protein
VNSGPASAAEWSLTPFYSSTVDYDSNRRLVAGGRGSEAAVLTADLRFKRALENWDIVIEPRYSFRRYSDSALGNGDDRSLFAGLDSTGERNTVSLTGSVWDQSTLLTEFLETGIVSGNTHRRLGQVSGTWAWNQTERRQLISQFSYMDVSYRGQDSARLPGYRYPTGTVGERFYFSEKGSFTLSAFGNMLSSDSRGNSSHEYGLQGEVVYAFSERTRVDATLGESTRVLAGTSSYGTDASVSLTHYLTLGNVALSYVRSLVPYGNGFLVERQQVTASMTYSLTPFLDCSLAALRVQNNQTTVLLNLDRHSYDSVSASLTWRPFETWNVAAQLGGVRTQTPGRTAETLYGWHSALTLTWTPFPSARSR